MPVQVAFDRTLLADLCEKWQISELCVFGSALRQDFGPDSDVDVLVSFEQGATPSLFDLSTMAMELEDVFGRHVDILTRPAVERASNPYRRREILAAAERIYAV